VKLTVKACPLHYLGNTAVIWIGLIEAQFVIHPQTDQHCHCHTNSKPTNINGAVALTFNKIAPRGFEIIFEHVCGVCLIT
jgi:hypothetical protein